MSGAQIARNRARIGMEPGDIIRKAKQAPLLDAALLAAALLAENERVDGNTETVRHAYTILCEAIVEETITNVVS